MSCLTVPAATMSHLLQQSTLMGVQQLTLVGRDTHVSWADTPPLC